MSDSDTGAPDSQKGTTPPAAGEQIANDAKAPTILGGQRASFRVVRRHAQGGLGVVSVAHDTKLDREVAVKELRPDKRDNPYLRQRFLAEAAITGQLAHPGIVPIYVLDEQDGHPFYAMRFIEGRTLAEAIQAYHRDPKPIVFRDLLQRLVSICQTLAYAHNKGIIHRDLKPANILLGQYGETLVVDWGLAKRLTADSTRSTDSAGATPAETTDYQPTADAERLTQAGQILGTPAYISPEQASGDPDAVGTPTDVFALGAILYELLTGRPPYQGADAKVILAKARLGQVASPEHLKRDVPRALAAVCRKAMAASVAERYAGAGELADELTRWLADEPVRAYREPLIARVSRWLSRHRTLTASAMTAVLAVAVSLACATVLLVAANDRERAAKEAADDNFRLAQQAVDRYCTAVSQNELLNEPGLRPLREKLLETAREFYQRFLDKRHDDPAVRAELGRAYWRLADLAMDQADKSRCRQLYEQALAIFTDLVRSYPDNVVYLHAQAANWNNLGGLLPDPKQGLAMVQQARGLAERLATASPGDHDIQRGLLQTLRTLSSLQERLGQNAEADEAFDAMLKQAQQMARASPSITDHQTDLVAAYRRRGKWYEDTERSKEAERDFREALAISEKLAKSHPEEAEYESSLVQSCNTLGLLNVTMSRFAEAAGYYDRAQALAQHLVKENPKVPGLLVALAGVRCNQAHRLALSGKFAGALGVYELAAAELQDVLNREPGHADASQFLCNTHLGEAVTLNQLGRHAEAARMYEKVLALENGPRRPGFRKFYASTLARAGDHARAVAEAQALEGQANAEDRFFLSCVYATAVEAVAKDQGKPSEERAALGERYAHLALDGLRQLADGGYFRGNKEAWQFLQRAPEFDPIRSREDFQQFLGQMETKK
jgi:serine/threonine-protein kinase